MLVTVHTIKCMKRCIKAGWTFGDVSENGEITLNAAKLPFNKNLIRVKIYRKGILLLHEMFHIEREPKQIARILNDLIGIRFRVLHDFILRIKE